jgi:hypothetical protein
LPWTIATSGIGGPVGDGAATTAVAVVGVSAAAGDRDPVHPVRADVETSTAAVKATIAVELCWFGMVTSVDAPVWRTPCHTLSTLVG